MVLQSYGFTMHDMIKTPLLFDSILRVESTENIMVAADSAV